MQNINNGRENLSEKSRIELIDLLCREEKLCKNTKFLAKLPDNGMKIIQFYEKVKEELQSRDNHEKLCGELAKLSVDERKTAVDRLEWTGDYQTDTTCVPDEGDHMNLLKILATHSGTELSKQKNIKIESPLLPDDLLTVDAYAKELCQRFDSSIESSTKKFHTHKPLLRIPDEDSKKHKSVGDSKVTSDPDVKNSTSKVKILSLQESIVAQHQHNKLLKEIEFRSALEKLRFKVDTECRSSQFPFCDYRDNSYFDSDDDDESD